MRSYHFANWLTCDPIHFNFRLGPNALKVIPFFTTRTTLKEKSTQSQSESSLEKVKEIIDFFEEDMRLPGEKVYNKDQVVNQPTAPIEKTIVGQLEAMQVDPSPPKVNALEIEQ